MPYLYETHMHTCQASKCGRSTGREHVRKYRDLGFAGIIITDHFFGGNCAVDRSLPWEEKIKQFCSGYEDALNEGLKIGFPVFFGWEQGYGDDEYLVYGLDREWLLGHPEIEHCSRRRQLELAHEGGGCVIQAHPFRARAYIQHIRLGLRFADGAEVANAGNLPVSDVCAYRYAQAYGLMMTAGSDNHDSSRIVRAEQLYGVSLEKPLQSIGDYVRLILGRGKIGLHVAPDRFVPRPDMEETPAFLLTEDERLTPCGRRWLTYA